MKAIIWIIILALVAWGVWYFFVDDETAVIGPYGNASGQVEGASDEFSAGSGSDLDVNGEVGFEVKG